MLRPGRRARLGALAGPTLVAGEPADSHAPRQDLTHIVRDRRRVVRSSSRAGPANASRETCNLLVFGGAPGARAPPRETGCPCATAKAVYTILGVTIEFDPAKDQANLAKHGVSLEQARQLEWDTALLWTDDRWGYGEDRQCGIGYIGMRLYFVVFVERPWSSGTARRIISLRKATKQEVNRYASS